MPLILEKEITGIHLPNLQVRAPCKRVFGLLSPLRTSFKRSVNSESANSIGAKHDTNVNGGLKGFNSRWILLKSTHLASAAAASVDVSKQKSTTESLPKA